LGEEVCFRVPTVSDLEADVRQVVPPGPICFWVQGESLPIPFRPTQVSAGDKCGLVTKVNVLPRLEGDSRMLKSVREGGDIRSEETV
jgi:uncharacterized protein